MAPRPIKLTASDHQLLTAILSKPGVGEDYATPTAIRNLKAKVAAALEPAPKGVAAAPLEDALVQAAGAKVARLAGPSGYARASRLASQKAATPELVAEVGRWVARWWSRGTLTLLDVLSRWDTWLPKALVEQAPKGLPEGLNGGQAANVGSSPGGASGSGANRRPPSGLR